MKLGKFITASVVLSLLFSRRTKNLRKSRTFIISSVMYLTKAIYMSLMAYSLDPYYLGNMRQKSNG